jgi:hypothetical protein
MTRQSFQWKLRDLFFAVTSGICPRAPFLATHDPIREYVKPQSGQHPIFWFCRRRHARPHKAQRHRDACATLSSLGLAYRSHLAREPSWECLESRKVLEADVDKTTGLPVARL